MHEPATPARDAVKLRPTSGRGLAVLLVLLLVNVLNFVDRLMPSMLVDAIRRDLGLTDGQIGLMVGVAFAVIYSFATVALAYWADRRSPRQVIVLSLAAWSLATALSGLAQNFWQLFMARAGVAAGEAGSTPSAHALIARIYPATHRALVMAVFSLAVPIGSTLGIMLGGIINDAFSWRTAFFVVGLPGILVAFLARWVVPDPPHQVANLGHEPFLATLRFLFARRSFRHMAAASSLFAIGSYAMNVFAGAFLIRVHHLPASRAGIALGVTYGIGGTVGTFAGGALGDWLGLRDPRWRQRLPALGLVLSAPCALAAFLVPDTPVCLVFLTLVYLLGLLYFAPTFAAVQMLVPDAIRASASGVLLFCLTLIGASIGPYVVGHASDLLAPRFGQMALRYALCLTAITMLWAALHFWLASRALPGDLARRAPEHLPSAAAKPV